MRAFLRFVFDVALHAYTASYRESYAAAMRADFAEGLDALRNPLAAAWYALTAYGDVLASALDERSADIRRDVSFTARSMGKTPGFLIAVVGTLALAIGANTAVFSVLHAVVLAPLPFPDADRILVLHATSANGLPSSFSLPDFADAHERSKELSTAGVSVSYNIEHELTIEGKPHAVNVTDVTPGFFSVFALKAELGRYFTEPDARLGSARTIVVADRFWRRYLRADPHIVGSNLTLESTSYRVIGVAPATLSPPGIEETSADAWTAFSESERSKRYTRDAHFFSAIARMRPGSTLASVRSELDATFADLRARYPQSDAGAGATADTLLEDTVGDVRPTLLAILAAVGGVLLVACANVANLLLGRATARDRELVVRLALGAPRRRIVMQLIVETFVFAALGGALGVALAFAGVREFVASAPSWIPRIQDVSVDGSALAYTLAVVVATTIFAGLLPAFALSRRDLASALQGAGRSGDASRGARGRAALVVFEIACTLALVVVAGVLVRSYGELVNRPLGFDERNVTIVGQVELTGPQFSSDAKRIGYFQRSLAKVRAIPGIVSAAWAFDAPFVFDQMFNTFTIDGESTAAGKPPSVRMNVVGPDYFRTLGIPLVRGRAFGPADRAGAPEALIVNEAFVRKYMDGRDPIGSRIALAGSIDERKHRTSIPTIVGVVADAHNAFANEAPETIFRPIGQTAPYLCVLAVKTVPGIATHDAIAAAMTASDPLLVPPDIAPLHDRIDDSTARTRLTMQTLAALALLALALSLGGIYAVVSYGVAQRTHEFGIRMALGAPPAAIRGGVIVRAMRVAGIGIALGIVLAAAAAHAVSSALYGVAPLDPITLVAIVALVAFATIAAAFVPAWRATNVDPAVALRAQ